jgi:caa(3)-type oxidase subunit IV
MTALLRTPATAVWVILITATGVSWALGTQHGMHDHRLASVIILLIAFIKVRLVGMYFMELRDAPNVLRGLFEAYCFVVCMLLLGVFIFFG